MQSMDRTLSNDRAIRMYAQGFCPVCVEGVEGHCDEQCEVRYAINTSSVAAARRTFGADRVARALLVAA